MEVIKTEQKISDCFFCGTSQDNWPLTLDEDRKWASCLYNLCSLGPHGSENEFEKLPEILGDAAYCSRCIEEFEKLEDLLSQLEKLRLELDLVKLNYKDKLSRTLHSAGHEGIYEQYRKREAIFECLGGRPTTESVDIGQNVSLEPFVVLEEGENDEDASLCGHSSESEDFAPSDDDDTETESDDDDDYEVPKKKSVQKRRERATKSKPKQNTSLSPIPDDLRSKHQLKDVVVKLERLPPSDAVSSTQPKPMKPRNRRQGMKYNKTRVCPTCHIQCSTSDELRKHLRSHLPKAPRDKLPCKVTSCKELFENAIERNAHIKEAHPDYKPFQCKFCLQSFVAKQTLLDHQNSHTKETPYMCSECGKTFINRSRLHRHKRSHGGRKNFLCDKCEKAFYTIQELRRHTRTHTNERPFVCEFCGRSFTTANYLRDHLPSHPESNLAKPLCKFCGKVFVSSVYLHDHEKSHVGDFTFWCDKCSFGATKRHKLERHMLTHSDVREFECKSCHRMYKSTADLKTHFNLVHSNLQFSCSVCNKTFTSRYYLLRHSQIHASEKKYSCDVCGYAFAVRRYLRVHMKKYHPELAALNRLDVVDNNYTVDTENRNTYADFVREMETTPGSSN